MLDQKIDTNQKYFSIYVFLSTFSRNLIEVFIPVILFILIGVFMNFKNDKIIN